MERRDILKEEAERLGRALGKLIAQFLGLKSTGEVETAIQTTNQQFKTELGLDIDALLGWSKQTLADYVQRHHFTDRQLELLAMYFQEIGTSSLDGDREQARGYLRKAVELLEIADERTETLSFERMDKQTILTQLLAQCDPR
jgi:hypothetical protein